MNRDVKNKQKENTFGKFMEKAVTGEEAFCPNSEMPEQNAFETSRILGQAFSSKKYDRLTRGLWLLIAVIIIFLVSSVLLILYSSYGNLNVLHAEKDTVALYEVRITNGGRIWIKDVKFLGPYSIRTEYKGMEGKAALLARFTAQYNIDMIICGESEIMELAENEFIVSTAWMDDVLYQEYKLALSDGVYYGFEVKEGLEVVGTGQIEKLDNESVIAVTKAGNTGRTKKSIVRFFEIYYEGDTE